MALLKAVARGYVWASEIARIIRGNNPSLVAMGAELATLDLSREVTRVDRPVAFFLGRYDRLTNPQLAADYLDRLGAPAKQVVWFERSAHNIPFEEPDAFQARLEVTLARSGDMR